MQQSATAPTWEQINGVTPQRLNQFNQISKELLSYCGYKTELKKRLNIALHCFATSEILNSIDQEERTQIFTFTADLKKHLKKAEKNENTQIVSDCYKMFFDYNTAQILNVFDMLFQTYLSSEIANDAEERSTFYYQFVMMQKYCIDIAKC